MERTAEEDGGGEKGKGAEGVTGKLINLDDHRRYVVETMVCLFCRHEHDLRHIADLKVNYWPCPQCDERASIAKWLWLYGR
jgi:hypothetical protein